MIFGVGVFLLFCGLGYAVCGYADGVSSDQRWGAGIATVGVALLLFG